MNGLLTAARDAIGYVPLVRFEEGLKRTIYSIAYNWLIRTLFGLTLRDVNFSFKLMRREVLDAITLRSEGSLIDAELIVKAKNHGFAIQQIGLDYFPRVRGVSHLSSPTVIFKILRELVTHSTQPFIGKLGLRLAETIRDGLHSLEHLLSMARL